MFQIKKHKKHRLKIGRKRDQNQPLKLNGLVDRVRAQKRAEGQNMSQIEDVMNIYIFTFDL